MEYVALNANTSTLPTSALQRPLTPQETERLATNMQTRALDNALDMSRVGDFPPGTAPRFHAPLAAAWPAYLAKARALGLPGSDFELWKLYVSQGTFELEAKEKAVQAKALEILKKSVSLNSQSGGLDAAQRKLCAIMGVTHEAFTASRSELAPTGAVAPNAQGLEANQRKMCELLGVSTEDFARTPGEIKR